MEKNLIHHVIVIDHLNLLLAKEKLSKDGIKELLKCQKVNVLHLHVHQIMLMVKNIYLFKRNLYCFFCANRQSWCWRSNSTQCYIDLRRWITWFQMNMIINLLKKKKTHSYLIICSAVWTSFSFHLFQQEFALFMS